MDAEDEFGTTGIEVVSDSAPLGGAAKMLCHSNDNLLQGFIVQPQDHCLDRCSRD